MKQFISCCLLFSLLACKEKKEPESETTQAGEPLEIYPVSSFFKQQIDEVDSLKLPTVKYTSEGGRKDTVSITMEEFEKLAAEFIDADISKPSLSRQYKESSFADQSIPSITFSYTARHSKLPVKRMDVILDPNPVQDDQVKTIYIEKKQVVNDTLINKRLYWKSHKNFQVITSKQVSGKPESITQLKVAWDNTDEFN
jgi:hypothetical protein